MNNIVNGWAIKVLEDAADYLYRTQPYAWGGRQDAATLDALTILRDAALRVTHP